MSAFYLYSEKFFNHKLFRASKIKCYINLKPQAFTPKIVLQSPRKLFIFSEDFFIPIQLHNCKLYNYILIC